MQSSLRSAMRSSLWGMAGTFSVANLVPFAHRPEGKNRHDCTSERTSDGSDQEERSRLQRAVIGAGCISQCVAKSCSEHPDDHNHCERDSASGLGRQCRKFRGRTAGCGRLDTPSPYMCGDCRVERIDAILNASISSKQRETRKPHARFFISI